MLKKEVLAANELLKDLSDEQFGAIEKLSKNDEQSVIDDNRSEWWNGIDRDVKEVFGVDKIAGVKSYKHLKDVLGEAKRKADDYDGLNSKIKTYEDSIASLNEQIKKGGGNVALKSQIESLERERDGLKNEVDSMKTSYQTKEQEFAKLAEERNNDKVIWGLENKYGKVLGREDVKFLSSVPKGVIDREIDAAKKRVLAKGTPRLNEEGVVVFYDEKDIPLKNPKKGLDFFTPEDLFYEELVGSGLLAKDRKIGGAGGGSNGAGNGDSKYVDLTDVSTQVEAVGIIEKVVLNNGILKTSPQFLKEVGKIAKENNVYSLPME